MAKRCCQITYNGTTYLPVRAVGTLLGTSEWHTKDPGDTSYKGKDYKDVYLHTDSVKQGESFQIMTQKKYSKLHLELAAIAGS